MEQLAGMLTPLISIWCVHFFCVSTIIVNAQMHCNGCYYMEDIIVINTGLGRVIILAFRSILFRTSRRVLRLGWMCANLSVVYVAAPLWCGHSVNPCVCRYANDHCLHHTSNHRFHTWSLNTQTPFNGDKHLHTLYTLPDFHNYAKWSHNTIPLSLFLSLVHTHTHTGGLDSLRACSGDRLQGRCKCLPALKGGLAVIGCQVRGGHLDQWMFGGAQFTTEPVGHFAFASVVLKSKLIPTETWQLEKKW